MLKRLAVLVLLAIPMPALADDMSEALDFCGKLDSMSFTTTCTQLVRSGKMPARSLVACYTVIQMALMQPGAMWTVKRINEFNTARNLCDKGFDRVSGYDRFVQGSQQ